MWTGKSMEEKKKKTRHKYRQWKSYVQFPEGILTVWSLKNKNLFPPRNFSEASN